MEIYHCGTSVKTIIGNQEGMITACNIRFGKANYEITLLLVGELKTIWMFEQEFITESKKIQIGYK